MEKGECVFEGEKECGGGRDTVRGMVCVHMSDTDDAQESALLSYL